MKYHHSITFPLEGKDNKESFEKSEKRGSDIIKIANTKV